MPRVRPLTEAARKAEAEITQRRRVISIITAAMTVSGFDRLALAKFAGIDYQVLNRRMRGDSDFRLSELVSLANALRLDTVCRAALLGAKEKCRYETGYRAAGA